MTVKREVRSVQKFLSPAEVARRLAVSVELVRVWLRAGKLRHLRTPLGRLVPVAEVERVAAERRARAKGGGGGGR
jgi:excisionase family DNA binding protein